MKIEREKEKHVFRILHVHLCNNLKQGVHVKYKWESTVAATVSRRGYCSSYSTCVFLLPLDAALLPPTAAGLPCYAAHG